MDKEKMFDILCNYFEENNKKRREEAIRLLEKRDFETLRKNYGSYYTTKEVQEVIESRDVQEVINKLQLSLKNVASNQTIPFLETYIEQEEEQWATGTEICLVSYLYTIRPIESCYSSAYHFTKSCMWKIEHQPNGSDTKRYLAIIEKCTA